MLGLNVMSKRLLTQCSQGKFTNRHHASLTLISLCLSKFNIFFLLLHFVMKSLMHTTKIFFHAPYGKNRLLETLPRCNRSDLICLPNRLSNSTLNLMNLSKASNFLCTRHTYPNLKYLSI